MPDSPRPTSEPDLPDNDPLSVGHLTRENDELRRMNALLIRSNQDLERFAFAASHDLKEPLRAIAAYGELLAKKCGKDLDDESAMFVRNIAEFAAGMRALLDDLLTYAEIGSVTDAPCELVDLNVVLAKVKRNLQMPIRENGALVVSADLPTLSAAREFHFVQLFQNLVANAIQYRSDANPVVRISVHGAGGRLEFAVSDNGLGVAPENHQRIFETFKRLHDNTSSGTGIGLAICQRVVEKYGGRIWVESQAGRGATFRFTLTNVEVLRHELSAAPGEMDARKPRVLLVDDNSADVLLFRLALEKTELNCELTVIDDGAEALALVRQQGKYATSPIPDLAVLDLNLPKNDGIQILRAMRDNRALASIPVAILSSGLSPGDIAKLKEFKVARCITKPWTLGEAIGIGSLLKTLVERGSGEQFAARAVANGYPDRATDQKSANL